MILSIGDIHIQTYTSYTDENVRNRVFRRLKKWLIGSWDNVDIVITWDVFNLVSKNGITENDKQLFIDFLKLIKEFMVREVLFISSILYVDGNHEFYIEWYDKWLNVPFSTTQFIRDACMTEFWMFHDLWHDGMYKQYVGNILYSPITDDISKSNDIFKRIEWDYEYLTSIFNKLHTCVYIRDWIRKFTEMPSLLKELSEYESIIHSALMDKISTKRSPFIVARTYFLYNFLRIIHELSTNNRRDEEIVIVTHFPFDYENPALQYSEDISNISYEKEWQWYLYSRDNLSPYFSVDTKYLIILLDYIYRKIPTVKRIIFLHWHTHKNFTMNFDYKERISCNVVSNSLWYWFTHE